MFLTWDRNAHKCGALLLMALDFYLAFGRFLDFQSLSGSSRLAVCLLRHGLVGFKGINNISIGRDSSRSIIQRGNRVLDAIATSPKRRNYVLI